MYQDRILLTGKDILEKEFKVDTRGYRPQEVDKFLGCAFCVKYFPVINRLIYRRKGAFSKPQPYFSTQLTALTTTSTTFYKLL